ncbi:MULTISPECIES: TrmB family transcriptional regulator [Brevibacterium]|uniref:TrmB family transcriptional regulator n=1 Tax=Brevibacterium TaxID=1696 RepID=UPI001866A9C2|nr:MULTISPECIES: helix-turn-helix domain-containing protein [Brevibacterium]
MIEQLVALGLSRAEAAFYVAVLTLGTPSVAQASKEAKITRTNGYEISGRLIQRGLLSHIPSRSNTSARGRPGAFIRANSPETLRSQWEVEGKVLDDVLPQLHAIAHKKSMVPRVRFFEGALGIKAALFETLDWGNELYGIFSMQDLLEIPGRDEMGEYIAGRRDNGVWLNVIRSRERDEPSGWPSDPDDFRLMRYAPSGEVFTMTTIIADSAVCVISSRNENFAMMIESEEYATTQRSLWDVLWQASSEEKDSVK